MEKSIVTSLCEMSIYFLRIWERSPTPMKAQYLAWYHALQALTFPLEEAKPAQLEKLLLLLEVINNFEKDFQEKCSDQKELDQHRIWAYCVKQAEIEVRKILFGIH